jgi:hypothetical protein
MDMAYNLKKLTTGALVSGAVAVAGLGLAAGTAEAQPFYWCPVDPRLWELRQTRVEK